MIHFIRRFAPSICLALLALSLAVQADAEPTGKAAQLIKHFRMQRIPDEGAWFAATYRSDDVLPAQAQPGRYQRVPHAAGSAIYALVTREDFSALHKLQTDEIWHYYGGEPLELLLLYPDGHGETVILGPDVFKGQHPQYVVPRDVWQGAKPIGSGRDTYTFFGDTLAPGFEYTDFTIGYRDELQKAYPEFAASIAELTRPEFATKPNVTGAKSATAAVSAAAESVVFLPTDVAKIDAGPGTVLRELIGRNAKLKTDAYSVALFTLAPGQSMPTSHNKIAEEVFLITAGQGEVTLDQRSQAVAPGSTVVIKPKVRHAIKASTDAPLSFYAISVPAFSPDDYVVGSEH